jgi:hypothetical protein
MLATASALPAALLLLVLALAAGPACAATVQQAVDVESGLKDVQVTSDGGFSLTAKSSSPLFIIARKNDSDFLQLAFDRVRELDVQVHFPASVR